MPALMPFSQVARHRWFDDEGWPQVFDNGPRYIGEDAAYEEAYYTAQAIETPALAMGGIAVNPVEWGWPEYSNPAEYMAYLSVIVGYSEDVGEEGWYVSVNITVENWVPNRKPIGWDFHDDMWVQKQFPSYESAVQFVNSLPLNITPQHFPYAEWRAGDYNGWQESNQGW
jgi:hypothetical protein